MQTFWAITCLLLHFFFDFTNANSLSQILTAITSVARDENALENGRLYAGRQSQLKISCLC